MAEEELPVPAPLFSVTAKVDKEKVPLPDAHDPATGHGRWLYEGRLGEGGLATVFRAWDCKGNLGCVAVKVLKRHSKAHARHAFAMHRESQWSLERLHNPHHPRYSEKHASLFARYLEDHTGFADLGPEDFEERRKFFESPNFDWYKQRVTLPNKPYVVMELVKGETLQTAMPTMSSSEKREVILQCATALEYLERFSLIHRDFRGCNMHLIARENGKDQCQLKILDLGVMISAEEGMEENCNMAVQAFRRRGDTEEKRKRYDWLPWEVRDACDDLQGPVRNFNQPGHSFDAFSLGVLILHLLLGKTKARLILDNLKDNPEKMLDGSSIGIPKHLLGGLLGEASKRPRPHEVFSQATQLRPSSTADKEGQVATPSEVQAIVVKSRSCSASRVSRTTSKVEAGSDEEEVELLVPEQGKTAGAKDENADGSTKEAALKEDTAKAAKEEEATKGKASATEELARTDDIAAKEDIAAREEPSDKKEAAAKENATAKEDAVAKEAEGLDKEQTHETQQKSKSRSRKRLRSRSRSRNKQYHSRRRNKKRSRRRNSRSRSRNKRNRGRSRRRYTKSRSRSRRRRSKVRSRSKRRRSKSRSRRQRRSKSKSRSRRQRRSKSRSRSRQQRRSKSRSRSRQQRRSKSRSRSRQQRRSKSRSRSRQQRRSKSRSRSRQRRIKSRSESKRHHSKSRSRQKKESSIEKKQRLRRERVQATLPQMEEKVVSSFSKQAAKAEEKSQELKEVSTGPTVNQVGQETQEAKHEAGEVRQGSVLDHLRRQQTEEEVEIRKKVEKQQELEQERKKKEQQELQQQQVQQQAQYQQLMQQQLLQQQIQQQMLVQQAEMIQQALAPSLPGFGMPMQVMQVAMSPAQVPVAQPAVPGVTKKASAPPPPAPMVPPMQQGRNPDAKGP